VNKSPSSFSTGKKKPKLDRPLTAQNKKVTAFDFGPGTPKSKKGEVDSQLDLYYK
jgi:hypothetical protein